MSRQPVQPSLYPSTGTHVQVAVDAPVRETFLYRVPEEFASLAQPGVRVRLKFSGRRVLGVITVVEDSVPDDVDPRRIRSVEDILDPEPVLLPSVLRLAEAVAEAYCVGLGEVLQLCLPPGGDPVKGRRATLEDSMAEVAGTEAVVAAMRRRGVGSSVALHQLERECGEVGVHASVLLLAQVGAAAVELEAEGGAPGARRIMVRLGVGVDQEHAKAATARAPRQREALAALAAPGRAEMSEAELVASGAATRQALVALADKGLVERYEIEHDAPAPPDLPDDGAGSFTLTAEQDSALEAVLTALRSESPTPILLHGVTGSGKTEVYLRAARAAVDQGRAVILLVPEIGLTPQLEQRARAVLGDEVVVVHSGMAAGLRARAWWQMRAGRARVVVGPRSAIFSPLEDVGLIVLDEEQDAAYKQGERPRYHGRSVAVLRGKIESATVVAGSATPAVETRARTDSGRWRLAQMQRRVSGRELPATRLVDMRAEWRDAGRTLVSRDLEAALGDRLERGEQSLIMLNRRGFASAIVCRVCGDRGECPNCAVSLTYHRPVDALVCHYCDHRQSRPAICAQCGATALHDTGQGTQRLQEAIAKLFPHGRVERFDADQTQRRGAHARILSSFARGDLDVLVGTQMLAKGHDFPAVTLVGVIGADSSLAVPDYRASERTFQLLTQVAGRAGRGETPGEVILQAHRPDHYAIDAALAHDYAGFYEREIEFRQRLGYPPFSSLALCVCRGKVDSQVREEADRLATALRAATSTATILGPAQPPIARLRGKFRWQVLVKAPSRAELPPLVDGALEGLRGAGRLPRDLIVDIEPDTLA